MTKPPVNNAHDKFARQFLTHPERARDFLNNFLPAALKNQIDFSTLEIDPTDLVDSKLQEHRTDVLFSLRQVNNEPLFVYVLVEHKSYLEDRVALQLLRYMMQIWEKCDKKEPLPMILPLVLYHGERDWNISSHFKDLFHVLPGAEPYMVDFSYQLLNLKEEPDENIKGGAIYLAQMLLMKKFFQKDLGDLLYGIIEKLSGITNQRELVSVLEAMVTYLGVHKFVDDDNVDATIKGVFKDQGGKVVVTMLTKAKAEGKAEGEGHALCKVLTKRYGPGDYEARIKGASLEQLDLWLDRALDSDKLEDVFGPSQA